MTPKLLLLAKATPIGTPWRRGQFCPFNGNVNVNLVFWGGTLKDWVPRLRPYLNVFYFFYFFIFCTCQLGRTREVRVQFDYGFDQMGSPKPLTRPFRFFGLQPAPCAILGYNYYNRITLWIFLFFFISIFLEKIFG